MSRLIKLAVMESIHFMDFGCIALAPNFVKPSVYLSRSNSLSLTTMSSFALKEGVFCKEPSPSKRYPSHCSVMGESMAFLRSSFSEKISSGSSSRCIAPLFKSQHCRFQSSYSSHTESNHPLTSYGLNITAASKPLLSILQITSEPCSVKTHFFRLEPEGARERFVTHISTSSRLYTEDVDQASSGTAESQYQVIVTDGGQQQMQKGTLVSEEEHRSLSDGEGTGERSGFARERVGAIHLIMGPMFAGKTTVLLQRVQEEVNAGRIGHVVLQRRLLETGIELWLTTVFHVACLILHLSVKGEVAQGLSLKVALVKSDKDTRYGVTAVVSHDGLQMPCVAVPNLAIFREHIGEEQYRERIYSYFTWIGRLLKLQVIGIDEAQFFEDLFDFCQSAADLDSKTVIVAGLDGDFLRRRFGSALDLVPLADSVTKLLARCELCGQPAAFTFRKTVDIQREIIGGADVYMPVCRHHFVSGQIAVETARTVLQVQQAPVQPADANVDDQAKPAHLMAS